MRAIAVFLLLGLVGCYTETVNYDDGTGGVSCKVSGVATAVTGSVNAVGAVTCDASTSLKIKTCIQWDASGSFDDVQCQSGSESDATSTNAQTSVACASTAPTRKYRARVQVTAGDGDPTTTFSAPTLCN